MSDMKAADLPVGSIVANGTTAIIRLTAGVGFVWHGTNRKRYTDEDVDGLIFADRFAVVREGL